jgi:uncharacterized protein YrzB (UPF0473 family)
MKNNTITMKINDETVTFDILYIFESFKTKKKFIIYTDNKTDLNGEINIYSAIYENDNLIKINDENDWKEVEEFLEIHMSGDKNE